MVMEKGAPVAYDLFLKRSAENNRRYTIEVTLLDPTDVQHPEYCLCFMTKCILMRAVLCRYENEDLDRVENDNKPAV